jgi:drug/metabolite transporter (DMT)-like permease
VESWQARSLWATLYLGVFGSLLGFYAYFTVLQKMSATNVTLVTLITPIIALTLGAWLNDEQVTNTLVLGATAVLLGLTLYHFGHLLPKIKQHKHKIKD